MQFSATDSLPQTTDPLWSKYWTCNVEHKYETNISREMQHCFSLARSFKTMYSFNCSSDRLQAYNRLPHLLPFQLIWKNVRTTHRRRKRLIFREDFFLWLKTNKRVSTMLSSYAVFTSSCKYIKNKKNYEIRCKHQLCTHVNLFFVTCIVLSSQNFVKNHIYRSF